jgi:hypothetical protein
VVLQVNDLVVEEAVVVQGQKESSMPTIFQQL